MPRFKQVIDFVYLDHNKIELEQFIQHLRDNNKSLKNSIFKGYRNE